MAKVLPVFYFVNGTDVKVTSRTAYALQCTGPYWNDHHVHLVDHSHIG